MDCRLVIGEVENITCLVTNCDPHSHTVDIYTVDVQGYKIIGENNTLPGLQSYQKNADSCSLHVIFVTTQDINNTVLDCLAKDSSNGTFNSGSILIGVRIGIYMKGIISCSIMEYPWKKRIL